MHKPIKKVVVLGGGTAGWITAGRIAAEHNSKEAGNLEVTLVESPNVPVIGVGEGTWPTMRSTLMKLGVSETDFIRQCDASFKQGAKFSQWVTGEQNDFYYHPLVLPQGFTQTNLAGYWVQKPESASFSNAVCFQEAVCEQGLAPKTIRTPEYSAVANYAYHLDAGKFTAFLQKHCTKNLGVTHVLADVQQVKEAENGDIDSLLTQQAGEITGDLFIDCSGFASLLLGKHYDVPFISCQDTLFIDNALAVQVPYDEPDSPIASHTISTAQDAGWIWDIGLQQRRGVGYVYASQYTSAEQAAQRLSAYLERDLDSLNPRTIGIRSGHRQKFWHRNCVAVGLSAGFLEPLEASALMLVELSAQMLAEQLPPCREVMDTTAKRFNQIFDYRWQRIIDFLKLHYLLSKRTDNAFWVDNRDPQSIPESLQESLELWKFQAPYDHDFTSNNEVFPAASYQYVLYGMGFKTEADFLARQHRDWTKAGRFFEQNRQAIQQAGASLPGHRELLEKINQFGLQPI